MDMYKTVDEYLHKITPPRPKVMQAMEAYAKKNGFPIIGPLVGRFLYQMATTTKARKVLELGSGYGYSAYWFSLAMGARGHVIMTDGDESNRERALAYLMRARLATKFEFLVGDAMTVARPYKGPFDIILNDIDKHEYPDVINFAARRLRPSGLFITDNMIWSGRIFLAKPDKNTQGIIEFTHRLYKDSRFLTTILPLRDGISVAVRK